ncbi:MAG: hypothetical protein GXY53_06225 [Desulfobulbus sp.]|nr:hypothetical protein [Desulfobulbus sp.]
MNRYAVFSLLFLAASIIIPGSGRAGVTINIGDPGFYGRLDLGGYPPPRLIYSEPIIARPIRTWYPPIYLRVPEKHIKKWYKYCDGYGACGRPVYFVEDSWYQDVYVPRYRKHHRVYAPPRVIHKPRYYEYRKHERRPPKKIYTHDKRRHHRPYDADRHRRR